MITSASYMIACVENLQRELLPLRRRIENGVKGYHEAELVENVRAAAHEAGQILDAMDIVTAVDRVLAW